MRRVLSLLAWLGLLLPLVAAKAPPSPTTVNVPILTYHYISVNPDPVHDPLRTGLSVEPQVFAAQLDWLIKRGYTTVTLDDIYFAADYGWTLPAKPVVLTFDDGYRDFYTEAWPLLQARQMKATIYLISDVLGQPNYLTPAMVVELSRSPLITVGAHTRTHPSLPTLSPQRSREEIVGGKQRIEQLIGRRVAHFCYPYGHFNDAVVAQVRDAGFVTATTTNGGRLHGQARWTWTRLSVRGGQPLSSFTSMLP